MEGPEDHGVQRSKLLESEDQTGNNEAKTICSCYRNGKRQDREEEVASVLMVVVLLAPFGPSRPKSSPSVISMFILSTATVSTVSTALKNFLSPDA